MQRLVWLALLAAGFVPVWTFASTPDFYVATTGSDTVGDGSIANPWATLDHARVQMRTLKVGQTRDQTVHFGSGNYWGTAASFTDADSGLHGFNVIYKSDTPEAARLSGGRQIDTSTCSLDGGSIYSCPLLTSDAFETMYVDGQRAITARTPNLAYDAHFSTQQGPYCLTQDTGAPDHQLLQYDPACAVLGSVSAATDVRVVIQSGGQKEWWFDVIPVTSINSGSSQMSLSQKATYYLFEGGVASRFYLKGSCAFLDAPGEYCLDRVAHRLRIYGNPVGHEIVVPVTKDVIRLVGADSSHILNHVVLDGLKVGDTDAPAWFRWGAWGQDYPAPPYPPGTSTGPDWDPTAGQPHVHLEFVIQYDTIVANQHAGIYAENTANLQLLHSHVLNTGYSGVYLMRSNQAWTVANNWVERSGYTNFETESRYPGEGDVNTGHTITNNLFSRPGEIVGHGRCVQAQVTNSTFSTNECGLAPREGLFVATGCSSTSTPSDCYVAPNTVNNWWIHDAVQDSSDAGGIYMASLKGNNSAPFNTNTYQQIAIDRVFPNPYARFATTLFAVGVYTDVNSAGQIFTNAEVTNARFPNEDNAHGHTLTNVSWTGAFSTAGMDYPNIGLPLSTFTYAAAATPVFDSDFSDLTKWQTAQGSAVTVGASNLCGGGTHSALIGDGQVQQHLTDGAVRRRVIVDFYDTGSSTAEFTARADEGTYNLGTFSDWNSSTSAWRGMGIDTSTSSGFYVTLNSGTTAATSVARSVGCHEFIWNYESNAGVVESIDGVTVATVTGVRQFNVIALGDFTADSRSGAVYVGRVRVAY